jgi:hypothetical protein
MRHGLIGQTEIWPVRLIKQATKGLNVPEADRVSAGQLGSFGKKRIGIYIWDG